MRLAVSLVCALLVTLALFYLMQAMISVEERSMKGAGAVAAVGLIQLQSGETPPEGSGPAEGGNTPPAEPARPASPPPMPTIAYAQRPAPTSDPLEVALPDLPRIAPGGKPYLGDYVRPTKKTTSAPPPVSKPAEVAPTTKESRRASQTAKADKKARSSNKGAERKTTAPAKSTGSSLADGPGVEAKARARSGPGTSGTGSGRAGAGRSGRGASGGSGGSGGTEEAVAVLKLPPEYPRKAAQAGQEGWVKLEFTITPSGTVKDPKVVASSPRRVFDRSALKAIRKWRFKPKMLNGKAVSRRAIQLIEFSLAKR